MAVRGNGVRGRIAQKYERRMVLFNEEWAA
jgi:hypothetical protein